MGEVGPPLERARWVWRGSGSREPMAALHCTSAPKPAAFQAKVCPWGPQGSENWASAAASDSQWRGRGSQSRAAEPCCPQRRGEEGKISLLRPSAVFSLPNAPVTLQTPDCPSHAPLLLPTQAQQALWGGPQLSPKIVRLYSTTQQPLA